MTKEQRRRTREDMNTRFDYMYRDGFGCKSEGGVILRGRYTEHQVRRIEATLDEFRGFIPRDVGISDVSFWALGRYERCDDNDFAWHVAREGFFCATDWPVTDPRTVEEFVCAFEAAAARGWDDTFPPAP